MCRIASLLVSANEIKVEVHGSCLMLLVAWLLVGSIPLSHTLVSPQDYSWAHMVHRTEFSESKCKLKDMHHSLLLSLAVLSHSFLLSGCCLSKT